MATFFNKTTYCNVKLILDQDGSFILTITID